MRLPRARALETMGLILCFWGIGRIGIWVWPDGDPPISQFRSKFPDQSHSIQPKRLIDSHYAPNRRNIANAPQMVEALSLLDARPSHPTPPDTIAGHPQLKEMGPIELSQHRFDPRSKNTALLGSFWLLARAATGRSSSGGRGELGGSQMGARVRLPLFGQALAGHLRASTSPNLKRGKEAALGLSWRPVHGMAAEIIAEQRLALDAQGRTDPALLLAIGINDAPVGGGVIAEGYGQIGVVGHAKPDGFADGRLTVTTRISPKMSLGGGIWAGAQPDASRVDIGPTLLVSSRHWRAAIDWRIRIAGGARPTSGPSVTLGRNF